MGARFLAMALVATIGWYAWHWRSSELSPWQMGLRILIWSFVAAIVGKMIGILAFRLHRRRRQAVALRRGSAR